MREGSVRSEGIVIRLASVSPSYQGILPIQVIM